MSHGSQAVFTCKISRKMVTRKHSSMMNISCLDSSRMTPPPQHACPAPPPPTTHAPPPLIPLHFIGENLSLLAKVLLQLILQIHPPYCLLLIYRICIIKCADFFDGPFFVKTEYRTQYKEADVSRLALLLNLQWTSDWHGCVTQLVRNLDL